MKDIFIIATGGTIDKIHDPISETLVFSDRSYLDELLEQCRVQGVEHQTLMLKDSLDITDQDRELIRQAILCRPENKIIITHGTSTMTQTAEFLKGKVDGKTVVLFGAMRPFSLFKSDAGFNLGCAFAALQLLQPGVYITMNGQVFEAGTVRKDETRGIFESSAA